MDTELIDLTPRQTRILEFIRDYVATEQYPPSIRDILRRSGPDVGLTSPSSILLELRALEKAGFIRRARGRARAISLIAEEAAA